MPRPKIKEIKKELAEEEKDFGSGEESPVGGSAPGESESTEKMAEHVIGNPPKGKTLAEEVEEDEKARRTKPEDPKEK